ncbi:MAG: DUF4340 domain-containing protein, partial [Isosphaeraceae bacterium]
TLTFVAVALLLTGAAFYETRDRSQKGDRFNDQGQPFFADFKDPLACTDLEVVSFDPSTATATRFQVKYKDKKWVIPSHNDYPADAKDRLAKTAAAVMDLTKDTIRSDDAKEQEAMGVIDPLDAKTATLQGRGKRVTLRDSTEKVLADFIIGREIKGADRKEGTSLHYVRVPDQKRTYGVNVKADLSTRFADWIETNLLKLDTGKIRRIVFDNYKLQEDRDERGSFLKVVQGNKVAVDRKDSTGPWTMEGLSADKEVNEEQLRTLTDAVGDLKIVGVRPKPPGLKDPNDPNLKLTLPIVASLQSKGFFVTKKGLYSDQGDVIVTTDDGVVYTLRYGGPLFASGDELTAGVPDDAEKKVDAKKADAKKSEGTQESRYLIVTVSFDPTIVPKPEKDADKAKPANPFVIPDDPFAPDPNDPKYIADQKAAEEKEKRDQADYEKKLADGQKRVKELTDRFGPWYYATPVESFNKINLDTSILTKPKGAAGLPSGMPPLAPGGGFPGMGGFPQAHP